MTRNKSSALVGGAIGFGIFLAFALLPSLVYGGYAGLLLACELFGRPVPPTLIARGVVAVGMLLGVFGTAMVMTVTGALLGHFVGHLGAVEAKAPAARLTPGSAKQA
jgi:hypothetical protein